MPDVLATVPMDIMTPIHGQAHIIMWSGKLNMNILQTQIDPGTIDKEEN